MKTYDFRILQIRGTRAQLVPLCDVAADWIGTFECSAVWVPVQLLADARSAGFRFC